MRSSHPNNVSIATVISAHWPPQLGPRAADLLRCAAIEYQYVDEATERDHMRRALEIQTRVLGERQLGWYTGRTSPQTRRLVVEEGGFLYDADSWRDTPIMFRPATRSGSPAASTSPATGMTTTHQLIETTKSPFDRLSIVRDPHPRI